MRNNFLASLVIICGCVSILGGYVNSLITTFVGLVTLVIGIVLIEPKATETK